MTPAAKAVAAAQAGARHRLSEADVQPGCVAWMPWATVIQVLHRDHHKGKGDGVCVLGETGRGKGAGNVKGKGDGEGQEEGNMRPGRRAWNHPVVILKRSAAEDRVFLVAVRSFLSPCQPRRRAVGFVANCSSGSLSLTSHFA